MFRFNLRYSALISLLLLGMLTCGKAQALYPTADAPMTRSTALIEMGKAYLSGVCILKRDDATVQGCIINEFGISALSFTYQEEREKVKLHDVASFLDKWYIRKVMKKDIAKWMKALREGGDTYVNTRRNISYKLVPLDT